MAKEKEADRKMFVGVIWNCAAELKILLTALLFLCSIITVFQFLPARLSFSPSDLRSCISSAVKQTPAPAPSAPSAPPPPRSLEQVVDGGVIKRGFKPAGTAAYNFILMSAYRGGLNTFAVIGLSSKPLHVFGNPTYDCVWISDRQPITAAGYKVLPDWGYGRVYTTVVVNCTFPDDVGGNGAGGKLILRASTNGGGDAELNHTDEIEALTESPQIITSSNFTNPPKYDFLYCGSSLYGNLSPQRVREWLAYHIKLFGEKSHFVIHDAGGIHDGVMEVLRPWIKKGYITLQDIREQERFDAYYHNQFLVVNDCLHRYRFAAKWVFFFDVDEFIFVPKPNTIKAVMDSLMCYTQVTIEQMTMSNKLCLSDDAGLSYRKWGFEKLVFKDIKRGVRRDRKYAVQPRNVFATGVHMSQNFAGKTTHNTEGRIKYYHYHGTVSEHREPCRQLINDSYIKIDGTPYVLDTTMRDYAASVKNFELKLIGDVLRKTRQ
jgi:hypothetical protein